MKLRFFTIIWSIGALSSGCHSQGTRDAALSLQGEADEQRQALYDQVELIAGSGAEEDEPEPEEDERRAAEPAEPDASVDEQVLEEMGWSDDSASCGNGVLDENELCDYAILEGEGMCPDSCDPAPGCPDETLIVRGCMTRCMPHDEPSDECLAAQR